MASHGHSHSHSHEMDEHNTMTTLHGNMKNDYSSGGHDETSGHTMTFHLRTNLNLLFEPWNIESTKVLIGSCIGVLFVSLLYEGLKLYRAKMMHRRTERRANICSIYRWSQTIMHIMQVIVGYLLMLVVMTYQVYLGIAIVAGAGLGYFIFAGLIGDREPERSSSLPSQTNETPAMVLSVTNLHDFTHNENKGFRKLSLSDLGMENGGLDSETKHAATNFK